MTRVIDTYELSPMQAGMLFDAVSGVDRGVDVEQMVATLHEPLEEAPFLRAWQRVVERHAVLRSRYRWEGVAEPVKEVLDRVEIPVPVASSSIRRPSCALRSYVPASASIGRCGRFITPFSTCGQPFW